MLQFPVETALLGFPSFLLRCMTSYLFAVHEAHSLKSQTFLFIYRGILMQNQQDYTGAAESFERAIHFRPSLAGELNAAYCQYLMPNWIIFKVIGLLINSPSYGLSGITFFDLQFSI